MPTPSAAGTDRGNLEAARQYNGVLIREAECKKELGVGPRGYCFGLQDDRKLQRRGPTISKRPNAGSGGEVLRPEELLRCARILASPLLSTPERPWPAPDEFGSAGSRQNNFGEFDTTIVDSIRLHGPNIPGEWIRSAAPPVPDRICSAGGIGRSSIHNQRSIAAAKSASKRQGPLG